MVRSDPAEAEASQWSTDLKTWSYSSALDSSFPHNPGLVCPLVFNVTLL